MTIVIVKKWSTFCCVPLQVIWNKEHNAQRKKSSQPISKDFLLCGCLCVLSYVSIHTSRKRSHMRECREFMAWLLEHCFKGGIIVIWVSIVCPLGTEIFKTKGNTQIREQNSYFCSFFGFSEAKISNIQFYGSLPPDFSGGSEHHHMC